MGLGISVNVIVIACLTGLLLGSASSGVLGCYLRFTRSHRQARNPLVLAVGYLLIGIVALGSLLILLWSDERLGIPRRGDAYHAGLGSYAAAGASVAFFVVRAEIRWRKSSGLDAKSLTSSQRGED